MSRSNSIQYVYSVKTRGKKERVRDLEVDEERDGTDRRPWRRRIRSRSERRRTGTRRR